MSEYINIDAERSDEGLLCFHTNLRLTAEGEIEHYSSIAAMEEGSPVAQALSSIDGIDTLEMSGGEIVVSTQPDADWHAIVAGVTAALKEFFL